MYKIMKRLGLFVLAVLLYGCSCLAQIPPQYVYVDSDCKAVLPDYHGLVIATDNCELADIAQFPVPGTEILTTTMVEMKAIDVAGNEASVFFNVMLLDTIPPNIMVNPDWTGYTTSEIGDMYRTFYCWVQKEGVEYNQLYAGTEYTVPGWDTVLVTDTFRVFNNTIPIPDYYNGEWCTDLEIGIPNFK